MQGHCKCGNHHEDERWTRIEQTMEQFKGMQGSLIPILHEVQDTYGYLPEEILSKVSATTGIPMSEIYGVATFYSFFSLEPKGEHVIRVCMGTACYIKGAQTILDRLSLELKVDVQRTTEDGQFTLDATRCLGACGLAPVIMIDDKVYGRLTSNDVPKIIKEFKASLEAPLMEV